MPAPVRLPNILPRRIQRGALPGRMDRVQEVRRPAFLLPRAHGTYPVGAPELGQDEVARASEQRGLGVGGKDVRLTGLDRMNFSILESFCLPLAPSSKFRVLGTKYNRAER